MGQGASVRSWESALESTFDSSEDVPLSTTFATVLISPKSKGNATMTTPGGVTLSTTSASAARLDDLFRSVFMQAVGAAEGSEQLDLCLYAVDHIANILDTNSTEPRISVVG